MRIITPSIVASITALGLALAGPAFAQSGTTQSPPSPNASTSAPQPTNSVPSGAATATPGAPSTGVVSQTPTGGTQPGGGAMPQPAAPSGSTGNQPSGAFQQTVPQPATR